MMYAEKSSKNFGVLQLQQERWMPRNKHKQYAIFWFTMAAVFCGFFSAYAYVQKTKD